MRSNSLFSLVFASIIASAAAAQTTYSVVAEPQTTDSSVAPVEAPKPVAITKPTLPEPTTFAPSDEKLSATSYQAMFRVDAFTVLSQVASFEAAAANPR